MQGLDTRGNKEVSSIPPVDTDGMHPFLSPCCRSAVTTVNLVHWSIFTVSACNGRQPASTGWQPIQLCSVTVLLSLAIKVAVLLSDGRKQMQKGMWWITTPKWLERDGRLLRWRWLRPNARVQMAAEAAAQATFCDHGPGSGSTDQTGAFYASLFYLLAWHISCCDRSRSASANSMVVEACTRQGKHPSLVCGP